MTVTEESGGRLNAFANEPKIEVIAEKHYNDWKYPQFVIFGGIFLISIISVSLIIK
ncbi:DNA-binding protein [Prochlorococcus marinus]|uniref:DNA-binding protein n=1 Tax=Prochlorococcus marinus TaxID=1219 RepID=UPI0022B3950A|nr:DNA-binding protein [Prochlorococcus marinus]